MPRKSSEPSETDHRDAILANTTTTREQRDLARAYLARTGNDDCTEALGLAPDLEEEQ